MSPDVWPQHRVTGPERGCRLGIAHAWNKYLSPVVLGLRAGCCPDPVPGPDGRTGRHLIHGLEFKTATDEHGNHRSAGTERTVPCGLVALAIQYGHMRTAFDTWASEGYGSRSRNGIHDLIELETAFATADTAAALREDLDNGGGISGPAARRAIMAAAAASRFAGVPVTLAAARKLLKNEDAMIYDNPHALVICHYKREKALCHRDGTRDTPSLDHCVPGCGNIARTDTQAAQLRERADALETQAQHVPQPVGDRLRAAAAKLREQADKHDRTRITPGRAER
ncbi:MAG TPA: hypothetical protein VMV07_16075 [Streptosporangiaceae bacterium]|nr:hypothetical protein [Streptosporangiaceae bacterium]